MRDIFSHNMFAHDTPDPDGAPVQPSGSTDASHVTPHQRVKISDTRSPADAAFDRFKTRHAERKLFKMEDGQLSESDTRSKFIDPIFKEVLGWHESEIRREKPVSKGYVDYVLGSDYNYLLIEAKRALPRFQLSVVNKPRRVRLDGPHLLSNKKMKLVLEQAQAYAGDLGVQFCLVTNGSQFIVFRPYVPGRSWKQANAIVFHDHRDIDQHFAEFYNLLSRDNVLAGSLVEGFEHLERTTTQLYSPLDTITDPDRELLRNAVWQQISRTMGPLLTDQSEDLEAQLEVIRHCYVSTPLADQTDENLDALLKDAPGPHLATAQVIDLKPGAEGRTAFSHKMQADVKQAKRGAYILTGGVGSGKTTFLRRFARIVDSNFVSHYTIWLHIDFLPIGNVDPGGLDKELKTYVFREVRKRLETDYKSELLGSAEALRECFAEEIDAAKLTVLHALVPGSAEWHSRVNDLVDELYRDDEKFAFAGLRTLRGRGRRVALILDNTDQLGDQFQETVFLLAQKLSADYSAICVVTLREEKFFAAFRRGIFDAFGDRRFHIGSPDLRKVLRKRLEYGRSKFAALEKAEGESELTAQDFERIDALLQALINSTTGRNANIVRMLASVSNGDMRHALDMFRDFLSSGNTNIEKIIDIVKRSGGYTVPFHEFAKSAILGSRKYYRSDVSHIVNLFKQSDALGATHMTACRVLARLSAAEGSASPHGEGFVAVSTLLKEYRESFGFADDFVQWSSELLSRKLIESEPPRVPDVRQADAIRITAAGSYYWRYLVRSFAYVDLVLVDTPVADHSIARKLATMAELTDMTVRFERVRCFIDYLRRKEAVDLAIVAERAGPFQEALIPQIEHQIEAEIKVISRKVHVPDIYRDE